MKLLHFLFAPTESRLKSLVIAATVLLIVYGWVKSAFGVLVLGIVIDSFGKYILKWITTTSY